MPPKRVGGRSNKGVIGSTYEAFTSPENASVVRSVAIFGAAVAFLASPWSEYLLPP
ncbi:putative TOM core complex subunit Tom6 [Daldinia sp. FL1419]|nr:putative TOM core complex subunit Tom6 [Daldinia sp. FL1419]